MARFRPTPTDKEQHIHSDDFVVSKTDPSGKILYGNRIFIKLSGYSEQELLGTQHNIIRHPDMPRCVFDLLWTKIKAGHEVFAYVKNLRKDGGFYWVFANVTASHDPNNNLLGYYSVRRKPSQRAIQSLTPVYAMLCTQEKKLSPKAGLKASGELLNNYLHDRGVAYDEFILGL